MLKKLSLAFFVSLLFAGNAGLSQAGRYAMEWVSSWDNHFVNSFAKSWPLNDAEETAGKSAPGESVSEEFEDFVSLKWASLQLSGVAEVCGDEAADLFKSIDRDIIVPPPRA